MALPSLLIQVEQITNSWKANKVPVMWHIMEVALTVTPPLQKGAQHFRCPQLFCPNILFYRRNLSRNMNKQLIVLLYFEVRVLLIHLLIHACDRNPNFIFREGIGKQKKRKITKKLTKLNIPKRKKPNTNTTSLTLLFHTILFYLFYLL